MVVSYSRTYEGTERFYRRRMQRALCCRFVVKTRFGPPQRQFDPLGSPNQMRTVRPSGSVICSTKAMVDPSRAG